MIQKFISKRDTNGNRKTLIINHVEKTYKTDYNPFDYTEYIEITARARCAILEGLKKNGYKKI